MNVIGCHCLKRECKQPHPFARAWVCSCVDPACKEPIHVVADEKIKEDPIHVVPDEKIKEEPIASDSTTTDED